MSKNQIVFAKPLDSSESSHGCSPICGVELNEGNLSMTREDRFPFDVKGDPGQQYRQVGFLVKGDQKVAVVVQKQEGLLLKNSGSFRLLFNGMPTKQQARKAQEVVKTQLQVS